MLSVKLVRSLVLGESLINHHHHHHHHHQHDIHDDDILTHVEYDADNDDDDHHHLQKINKNKTQKLKNTNNKNKKKKMPLLLFIPTNELISDTFRLATIAREIGMNFYPTNSLSHLLFSWPSSSSSSSSTTSATASASASCALPSCSTSSPFSPFSTPSSSNNRPSVSSNATTSTSTSTSTYSTTFSTFWSNSIPNDAVPLPFPSLSTVSSISLLRYFVSLSKNLFKLVFLEIEPNSRFYYSFNYDYDCVSNVALISRVSGKQVNSMEEFSRVLAGNGWALFRSSENKNSPSSSSLSSSSSVVYLFRKEDWNRIRAKKMINGDSGECRIRELRLPTLDFKNGVPLRILQYILLMTDDLFYLA